jgi:hypothetical protein
MQVDPARHPNLRNVAVLSAVVLAAVLLSGCAGTSAVEPAAPASPDASSTPAPTADPVSTIRFSGSAIESLDTAGEVRDSVSLGDGADAVVAGMSAALGVEATVTDVPEQCAAARTDYAWEGITLSRWTPTELTIALSGASSGGLRLEVTGGYAVGDDVSAAVAALPSTDVGRFDPSGPDLYASLELSGTSSTESWSRSSRPASGRRSSADADVRRCRRERSQLRGVRRPLP